MIRALGVIAIALFVAALVSCSMGPVAGNASEITNGFVTGSIVNTDGSPASNTVVRIIHADYDPVKDFPVTGFYLDTTANSGSYHFIVPDTGCYSIEALHQTQRTRLLITGINVHRDTVYVPTGMLKSPGTMKIILPDEVDSKNGYVYIPGSTYFVFLANNTDSVMLDSVSAGTMPSINYSAIHSPEIRVIRYEILVTPGDTANIVMPAWKYSKQLYLNTTATGADVSGTVTDFPVLVRLTSSTLNFTEAKTNGDDIRFTKSDGVTTVPYEIEQWDVVNKLAAIWVNVDTIYGNNGAQSILMYWGNPGATSLSNSAEVFDTTTGFQGVWHLGEPVGAIVHDATLNHYDGTPSDTAPLAAAGMIGKAKSFNGESTMIRMKGTASGKLNFPQDGFYSISVWVYANALNMKQRAIVSKGNALQYHLQIKKNLWEFANYDDALFAWDIVTAPAAAQSWKQVAGVRIGTVSRLYVDGVCVCSVDSLVPNDSLPRDTSYDVNIGCIWEGSTVDSLWCYFDGLIDEVQISNVARDEHWIKLCYMNQKETDALIQYMK